MRFISVLCLLASSSLLAAVPDPSTPRGVVETIIARARALDGKDARSENARQIESYVDFKKLTEDALGDRGKQATAAQRKEIESLLRQIITRTVYPEAPKFFRDVTIEFTSDDKSDSRAHVTSLVTKGDKRNTVEYWLADENGTYRVVDLAIEGERWVENVHDQFDDIIRKSGVPGLIGKMKKRLSQFDSKSKS